MVCAARGFPAGFSSLETAECFRVRYTLPGIAVTWAVLAAQRECLLREGKSCEFATAVKHRLQQPKEHYHSFHPWPRPCCIKKKTFHFSAQCPSPFVSFCTVWRGEDGFLNSSTQLLMEQIAVKSYIWLLPGFQQRECCVYSTKLRHKTTPSLDTAFTGRECEF